MKKNIPFLTRGMLRCFLFGSIFSILLTSCASKTEAPSLYDFGSPNSAASTLVLPPIVVAEVGAPAWLDGGLMFYRLGYANDLQARPYAGSRWSMTPAQLLGHRLKSRIAQGGGTVLTATDGALNLPLLRIDIDDFIQRFDSPKQSLAQVTLRASLFNGRNLKSQKTFSRQVTANSADAAGGARALATASDALIDEIIAWLAVTK